MRFLLYLLRHPADGFWEIKHENKGKLRVALGILLAVLLSEILKRQTTGFIFNDNYNVPLDIFFQIRLLILPVFLFCISNWALTTLMDGKGTFPEIFIVLCYSFLPMIFFNVLYSLLSNVFSLSDFAYLALINVLGIGWTCLMLFIGIQVIHEYSFGKMLLTTLLTVLSAAVVIFICLLFFSLLQEMGNFIYSIYREISLRI